MRGLTILILLLSFLANAQNSQTSQKVNGVSTYTLCNPDSCGTFQLMYNDVYNVYGFYKTTRKTYYYNANNKNSWGFSQWSTMNVNDTLWTNDAKWINTYDANNNLIDSVTMVWYGSSWVDSVEHFQYAYDLNQNLNSITRKTKGFTWNNYIKTIYAYNSANLTSSVKYQNWDLTNNQWRSFDSIKYVYDNNNLLINKHYFRVTSNPSVWDYYAYDTTHYNSLNSPTYLLKKWLVNNVWTNQKEIVWTYDASNRILSRVYHEFMAFSNYWENDYDSYYAYDMYGRQILQSASNYLYYSNCIAAGLDEKNKVFNFSISPNPTNSILSIKSSLDYNTVKIINSIGQTVSIIENKSQPISVSELSTGIYFIQLLDKKGTVLKTEKFIKN